ncbi:MAG: hypothetical protein J5689_03380, partial [Clostridia bacterium]|nr:hypothetical protein [Clostridia bacterium]
MIIVSFFALNSNYKNDTIYAETSNQTTYYSQLNSDQKGFYNALVKMNNDGLFARGESLQLNESDFAFITSKRIENYAIGDKSMLVNFETAKTAFLLDNPEIFYVNFENLALNCYKIGENYVAEIGSTRAKSYLIDGFNEALISANLNKNQAGSLFYKLNQLASVGSSTGYKALEKVVENFSNVDSDFVPCGSSLYDLFSPNKTSLGYALAFKIICNALGFDCLVAR